MRGTGRIKEKFVTDRRVHINECARNPEGYRSRNSKPNFLTTSRNVRSGFAFVGVFLSVCVRSFVGVYAWSMRSTYVRVFPFERTIRLIDLNERYSQTMKSELRQRKNEKILEEMFFRIVEKREKKYV